MKTQPVGSAGVGAPASAGPERLVELGTGFWSSKVFLSAVHLDLFTVLAAGPRSVSEIEKELGLHPRAARDFLDALVALSVLGREDGIYRNTPEAQLFLNKGSPHYIGEIFLMLNQRLYGFWGGLEEALRSGRPQNETRQDSRPLFEILYSDPAKQNLFVRAMVGLSAGSSVEAARRFDFSRCRTFCDLGGGPGTLNIEVAKAYPNLRGINMDLPAVEPIFREYAQRAGVVDRVEFVGGDCFSDPLPEAEVYALGNLLHGFGEEDCRKLLAKVYRALPKGGTLLVIEALVDEERRHNLFGLLMSLDMLIETEQGRNRTGREICQWLREVGFEETRVASLGGPFAMAVARK
ncbi:MAG: methyltransferase domain-containing protein [Elusimicrobia bacterium]|nr:methyltransferase domain-containing protein [Elusimicrobiota bacterium]